MKSGDIIELSIDSIAFGGAGVGRYFDPGVDPASGTGPSKGMAVFVEDTVPGDKLRVRIGSKKRNYAIGYAEEFLQKSPGRIEPRCKHFGTCGGCSLQYLPYEQQLRIKEQQVRDAMKRIGGFDEEVVVPIIGCKEPWFYRNKMEFSFSRTPGTEHEQGKLCLGLHVRRRHHDVTELEECFLQGSYIGEFVLRLRDFFRKMDADGRIVAGMKPVSLVVREGKRTGEILVNLIFENGEPDFLDGFVKEIQVQGFPKKSPVQKIAAIYFTNITNVKGSPKSVTEKLLWGENVIREELQMENGVRLKFEISPQAFFQPNTLQAELLYGEVLKAASLSEKEVVYDLYCGAGTIGIFCSHASKKVLGIEMNESAVKNARANADLNGINNIEFVWGDVGNILDGLTEQNSSERPDVIIVDPPRNGLDPKALDLTAQFSAGRIVYVSCNPTTLARDLQLFTKTGYKLLRVQPVDMFPHTYHIECVAVLNKDVT